MRRATRIPASRAAQASRHGRRKWPWFGELAARGYLIVAVHRGKNLLVTDAVARLLDPICRAEIERMRAADRGWRRLLDHLAAAGPSSVDDLRTELGLKRQELKSLRAPLERCGAIISRSLQVTAGEGHQHSSELLRWDQAYPGTGGTACRPQPGAQGPARRRRPRLNRRTRARAAPLVLLAVVLDRHARRRPSPRRAAAQGGRSRHDGRPGPARRRAGAPGHIRGLRLKSPTVNFSGGQEPPERLLTSGC